MSRNNVAGKRVAIVGAGLSGLVACKYVLSKGFNPIVFESRSTVGGVWIKTLETTKLQTPKSFYQFSDYPWPDSVAQEFPDHSQVMDYIQSYADHFGLLSYIRFNSKVVTLRHTHQGQGVAQNQGEVWAAALDHGAGKWLVTVHNTLNLDSKDEIHEVEFVILCVGRFSDVPNIPEFEPGMGPEVFGGKVMHSMEYSDMDNTLAAQLVKGKRVAIIGSQKSAMDIAFQCSIANGEKYPCTMVYRTKHWNLPDYLPWGLPLAFLYLNRFSELLVHKPGEGFLFSLLATLLSPLRWAFAKFVESDIKRKHGMTKFGMVPNHGFLKELSSCTLAIVPQGFYDRVEEGSIRLKEAANGFGFWKEGIFINNNGEGVGGGEPEKMKVDVVILSTGYKGSEKLKETFSSLTFRDCITGSMNNTVPLYRECVHPRIPQLAVIGFSESLSNLYTSEMRSRWVAELIDGKVKLPSVEEMEKDIAAWDDYMKTYSGDNFRRSCIAALHIWYNDQLCRDMGWNPKRKSGFLSDLFLPYGPPDYAQP